MDGKIGVKVLRCEECGTPLPVMGRFVTFQCPTCFRFWIINSDRLAPLAVYRAPLPEGYEGDPLLLPFWMIEIEKEELRGRIDSSLARLNEAAMIIAGKSLEESRAQVEITTGEIEGDPSPGAKTAMIGDAVRVKKSVSDSEINFLLRKLEGPGFSFVYVPAFHTVNGFAYLKVGRLLTRVQPSFKPSRVQLPDNPVYCALTADDALSLIDYVFFATLPESIRECAEILEDIELRPASPPRLVEFPFEQRGADLKSLIGDFNISIRLLDGSGRSSEE